MASIRAVLDRMGASILRERPRYVTGANPAGSKQFGVIGSGAQLIVSAGGHLVVVPHQKIEQSPRRFTMPPVSPPESNIVHTKLGGAYPIDASPSTTMEDPDSNPLQREIPNQNQAILHLFHMQADHTQQQISPAPLDLKLNLFGARTLVTRIFP